LIKHLEWWRCLLLLRLIEVGVEVVGWSAILRTWLSVDKARVYNKATVSISLAQFNPKPLNNTVILVENAKRNISAVT